MILKKERKTEAYMLNNFFCKLKNGSDIRGTATGENIDLTNEVIERIATGFITWISSQYGLSPKEISVAIGHDSRISASRLKNVLINTIRAFGVQVYDCGLASTPAMFMSISVLKCTASIEITASHLPSDRNGLKFFIPEGSLESSDIEKILEYAQEDVKIPSKEDGKVRAVNIMSYYSEKLKKIIKEECGSSSALKGLKVSIDAGNGVGGFFAKDVLSSLGAEICAEVGIKPDGTFPIHIPNPENKEATKYFSEITKSSGADIGIMFDTDVDRVAIISGSGKVISGTKLIAFVAKFVLKQYPHCVIVTDSMTYESLKGFIEKNGGHQFRYKRGYKNVINMAKKINEKGGNCPLAIETSGHAAFKENDFMDDGAYLACKILVEILKIKNSGKTIENVIEELETPKGELDIRIKIKDNLADVNKVMKDLSSHAKSSKSIKLDEENAEGVRIYFPSKQQNGLILLRKSLHEPELVLHAESYAQGGLRLIINYIKPFLKKYDFLNISELLI